MTIANGPVVTGTTAYPGETRASAVSWAAVFAGAFVAAAVTLILFALGTGFGLASVSPWAHSGAAVATFSLAAAVWLVIVQWIAAAFGGYLTGRLRVKWAGLHTHEVAFRDTAHGFLTWAVATVLGAIVLASAASALIGGGVHATTAVASQAAQGAAQGAASGPGMGRDYAVDTLFRSATPNANGSAADSRGETTRILAMGAVNGDVSAADRGYLAQLVAARTGLSADEAKTRVDTVLAQVKAAEVKAREAADRARKAASALSIFTAVSMLIGAFIASVAAALGGRQRDLHP